MKLWESYYYIIYVFRYMYYGERNRYKMIGKVFGLRYFMDKVDVEVMKFL